MAVNNRGDQRLLAREVLVERTDTDVTLSLTIGDLKAISGGRLSPMTAMMSGRLSLSDMGVAADLQGKMQRCSPK